MKNLLTLNVHFSFSNNIYIQIDGVAMGPPLDPVLANICMVELESVLVPKFPCQKMETLCGWHLWIRQVWFD